MDVPAVGAVTGASLEVVPRWGSVQAHCSLLLCAREEGERDGLRLRHAEQHRTERANGEQQQEYQGRRRKSPPSAVVWRTTLALLQVEDRLRCPQQHGRRVTLLVSEKWCGCVLH